MREAEDWAWKLKKKTSRVGGKNIADPPSAAVDDRWQHFLLHALVQQHFPTLRHIKNLLLLRRISSCRPFGCCTTEATTTRRNINAPDRAAKRTCISFFKKLYCNAPELNCTLMKRWRRRSCCGKRQRHFFEEEKRRGNHLVLRGNGVCSVAYGTRQFIINDCSARYRVRRVRRRASDSTFLLPPSQQLPTPTFSFFSCRDKWFSTLYRHPLAWYFLNDFRFL